MSKKKATVCRVRNVDTKKKGQKYAKILEHNGKRKLRKHTSKKVLPLDQIRCTDKKEKDICLAAAGSNK